MALYVIRTLNYQKKFKALCIRGTSKRIYKLK